MSSYSDPTKLFSVLKERAKTQSDSGSMFGNPNVLKFEKNNVYTLRLLWLPSETREYPMINQYVHRIWDNNAVGTKDVTVVCPTSQYDQDNAGFKSCPICDRMSSLYKEASQGSASADELYKKFKRTLRGYVPVYVVNGPEKDLHKVKILQYTISFKRYFDEKIFGIQTIKKNEENGVKPQHDFDESESIGINAFMYYDPKTDKVMTKGYNFIVTVGAKNIPINGKSTEVPEYRFDFSRKETTITDFDGVDITPEYFKNLSKDLRFDEDFYKMASTDALMKFKMKYIDGIDDVPMAVEHEEPKAEKSAAKKTVIEEVDEEPVVEKPVAKKAVIEEVDEEPEPDTKKSGDVDDIDLDELLAGI